MTLGCVLGEIVETVLRLATKRDEDRKGSDERKEGTRDDRKK